MQPCELSRIESAKIINSSAKLAEIELIAKIKNPNAYGFTIYPSEFNINISNVDVGKASLSNKIHIPAKSEISHKLIVQTDISKILTSGFGSLFTILQNGAVPVRVKGELNAGTFFVRKKFPIDLKENIPLNGK